MAGSIGMETPVPIIVASMARGGWENSQAGNGKEYVPCSKPFLLGHAVRKS